MGKPVCHDINNQHLDSAFTPRVSGMENGRVDLLMARDSAPEPGWLKARRISKQYIMVPWDGWLRSFQTKWLYGPPTDL